MHITDSRINLHRYEVWSEFSLFAQLTFPCQHTVELQWLKACWLVYPAWRTRFWVPMIPNMRLLWSYFRTYIFLLLFSFSIFSDWQSLKIENENNNTKTDCQSLIYGARVFLVQVDLEANPGWLEIPLTWTNFHGVSLFKLLKFYCIFILSLSSLTLELNCLCCIMLYVFQHYKSRSNEDSQFYMKLFIRIIIMITALLIYWFFTRFLAMNL